MTSDWEEQGSHWWAQSLTASYWPGGGEDRSLAKQGEVVLQSLEAITFKKSDKGVEPVGGGSVINGAYPV